MGIAIPVRTASIRRLDPRRDLFQVAELIEVCFFSQMDQEGQDYLRQIRRAANNSNYIRWIPGARENIAIPLDGYIWEEDGKIVGNLTLIPYFAQGEWRYLIANVAVHPDCRRKGIAKQLTEQALDHIREHGANSAWLQVRDDNLPAYTLYQSLGFQDRASRTTWQGRGSQNNHAPLNHLTIGNRSAGDWAAQSQWLKQSYPSEVRWNLPIKPERYNPDLWHSFLHWLKDERIQHWSVRQAGTLVGVATIERHNYIGDNLWLAMDPNAEADVLVSVINHASRTTIDKRIYWINYPAGRAETAFRTAGMQLLNTLIWMETRF